MMFSYAVTLARPTNLIWTDMQLPATTNLNHSTLLPYPGVGLSLQSLSAPHQLPINRSPNATLCPTGVSEESATHSTSLSIIHAVLGYTFCGVLCFRQDLTSSTEPSKPSDSACQTGTEGGGRHKPFVLWLFSFQSREDTGGGGPGLYTL